MAPPITIARGGFDRANWASGNYCLPQDAIFRHRTVFVAKGFLIKLVLSSNQVLYETVAPIIPSAGMCGCDFHFFQVWQPDDVERRCLDIAHLHDDDVLAYRRGDEASRYERERSADGRSRRGAHLWRCAGAPRIPSPPAA